MLTGRAERYNRLMIEGTKCFLLQSGLGERWWPLAIMLFCMNYNALFEGPDGLALWMRRFGVKHEFRPYPFGAFVLCIHLSESPCPGAKTTGTEKRLTKKLRSRLIPAIFVVVSVGPGCQWARTYQVVPLASLLSENRASRVRSER